MGTERLNLYCKVGKNTIKFQGAKWFYNDGDVRRNTGIKTEGEAQLKADELPLEGAAGKQYLARLVATLAKDSVAGNAAQSEKRRTYQFYCDPDKCEEAMVKLKGKTVDASLLPGNWKIVKVARKLQISRA